MQFVYLQRQTRKSWDVGALWHKEHLSWVSLENLKCQWALANTSISYIVYYQILKWHGHVGGWFYIMPYCIKLLSKCPIKSPMNNLLGFENYPQCTVYLYMKACMQVVYENIFLFEWCETSKMRNRMFDVQQVMKQKRLGSRVDIKV